MTPLDLSERKVQARSNPTKDILLAMQDAERGCLVYQKELAKKGGNTKLINHPYIELDSGDMSLCLCQRLTKQAAGKAPDDYSWSS